MVPAVIDTLDHTAPAEVSSAALALVRRLFQSSATVSALGAEEDLGEAVVDEELFAIATRLLWELEPRVRCGLCVVREDYELVELRAFAVAPVLAADVAEFLAALATDDSLVSAQFSLSLSLKARPYQLFDTYTMWLQPDAFSTILPHCSHLFHPM